MQTLKTKPAADGFRMPAEFEQHRGTVLIWPVRPGSWTNGGREAQVTFTEIARTIAKSEKVFMLCDKDHLRQVADIFADDKNVLVYCISTNDSWARDIGPTCVVNKYGDVRGIDWKFNAWGGDFDGLYAEYEDDDAAALKSAKALMLIVMMQSILFLKEVRFIQMERAQCLLQRPACLVRAEILI